jgi:hypothetical protein
MTYEDVLIQILSEVTGNSKSEVTDLMKIFKDRFPIGHKLNEELPDDKAEKLINELRKEKAGILQWLIQGKMMVEKNTGHA